MAIRAQIFVSIAVALTGVWMLAGLILVTAVHGPSPLLLVPVGMIALIAALGLFFVKMPYRVVPEETGLTLTSLLGTRVVKWPDVISYRHPVGGAFRYIRLFRPADEADIWVVLRYRWGDPVRARQSMVVFVMPAVEYDFLRRPGDYRTALDTYVPDRRNPRLT